MPPEAICGGFFTPVDRALQSKMNIRPAVFWTLLAISVTVVWGYFSSRLILNIGRMKDIVTPANLRVPSENVSFYSGKRKLAGWYVPSDDKNSRSTVIVCHGWGASKGDVLPSTIFLRARHNLFYFDFTAHGESSGRKVSMGKYESEDILAAVGYLAAERPASSKKIGVWGFSMGASAAITAAAGDGGRIAAVAAESPFYSYDEITSHYARRFLKVPDFPFAALARLVVRIRLCHNPENYSPRLSVGKISPRPFLVIAAAGDENIPVSSTKKLFDAAGEPKSLKIFDSHGHGAAHVEHPEEYRKLLGDFFGAHLRPSLSARPKAVIK
ncbi:MAG: hypothetical protein CVU77_03870 [Elusimicrobia bacterium HGW-Elusimicrobia-1]|nr:MAG: hypothetical protein CVU77_03870 [Elusimicrobia bacterium HGW-Elusimicrobia-1]